jgi:hypothetical protein
VRASASIKRRGANRKIKKFKSWEETLKEATRQGYGQNLPVRIEPRDLLGNCKLGRFGRIWEIKRNMDLLKVIVELRRERERLDRVIASIEGLQETTGAATNGAARIGRRGRKSMGAAERQQVSARMKKYWEGRRPAG